MKPKVKCVVLFVYIYGVWKQKKMAYIFNYIPQSNDDIFYVMSEICIQSNAAWAYQTKAH